MQPASKMDRTEARLDHHPARWIDIDDLEPRLVADVLRFTRTWLQYGIFGFAVFCIVISAVEALFGR